ncbi:FtsW/RodA/SpoVE family cell cycle protein [Clostridium vitabionis]|uniref:FtsW/RodA/SpoVE family cell cycle protein n=1 Tax=Clostridium vitabionis TaxID=2784388 RepID=UPI00188B92CA|nr:FtsW/RodA/SpoVE family cell cycle protein [Clostridium vitabionis]
MFFGYHFQNYRLRLLVYILALSGIGLLAVRSAAEQDSSLFMKQAVGVGLSLAVCLAVSLVDYHRLVRYAVPIYGICIGLLGLVLILGINHKGAVRWLKLGPVQIQPSEFVKIGMVLFFAWFLERCQDTINRPVTILKMMVLCGIPLAMVFKQPNLSTTIVITVMLLCMIYSAGISYRWIGGALIVGIPTVSAVLYLALQDKLPFLHQYQVQRILARFFDSGGQYADINRQQNNSIMAIGSGQLRGKGLFNNTLASVKNGNFLSEESTDFIFAIIGEEMGFVGCMLVIALYAAAVFECLWIGAHAEDRTGKLICTGMASLLAFQSFANIAVATGIFPNTGLPLPFISSGISSMLSMFIGMGIVLNIGLQRTSESN